MKILFIVNPKAGGTDHEETLYAIRKLVQTRGFESRFFLTTGKEDERNVRKEIEQVKPDSVVVGGGDGTLQMVAKILSAFKLPMGILPLGSANGLATALEIPKNPIEAMEKILASSQVRPMDMLKFNGRHLCVHLSDIGANALMVKKYEEAGERGFLGYARYLLSAIQETEPFKVTIRTPGGTFQKEGFLMAFANAHKYGTGVQISEGSVSDGKFEICTVEQVTLDEAIKAGLTILNVFVDKDMFSDVITCSEAEVTVNRKTHFQIDGEYMGKTDHLMIEIVPDALRIIF